VLERGIARPDVRVRAGDVLVVGRDPRADVRLEDPQVSRRQATIATEGGVWVVSDLGATNPTRLLGRDGSVREVRGGPARVPYGQVSVGESLLTLYPIEA
jgi:S-DNA-T family DNA segregation ATPase FtsK/SpoIIIE